MNDMTCVRCHNAYSPQQIDFLDDGAVCRDCIRKADSDPVALARGEHDFLVSTGRRQLLVGIVMVAVGVTILRLSASGGSLVLVPSGMLLGGLYEGGRGLTNLSAGKRAVRGLPSARARPKQR